MPQRKKLRLANYDYTQSGYYFVTICTKDRKLLFGAVEDGCMQLSQIGVVVERVCLDLPNHNAHMTLIHYCIMPNHIHAIISIQQQGESISKNGLPEIVRQLKTFSSRYINDERRRNGLEPFPTGGLWQRSYHDRIIRSQREFEKIYTYLDNNPLQWELDCHHPTNQRTPSPE